MYIIFRDHICLVNCRKYSYCKPTFDPLRCFRVMGIVLSRFCDFIFFAQKCLNMICYGVILISCLTK